MSAMFTNTKILLLNQLINYISTDTVLGQYVGRLQRKYSQRLVKEALKSSTSACREETGGGGVGVSDSSSGGDAAAAAVVTSSGMDGDGWASGGDCGQIAGAPPRRSISREEESDLGSGSPGDEADGEYPLDSIGSDGGAL
jgi:hypothetical protein